MVDAPTHCNACRFWDSRGRIAGSCRRHAPAAGIERLQVARWPETRAMDGCGEGEAVEVTDAPANADESCRACVFWYRPGVGIDPGPRGDHLRAWWDEAGHCRRFAPRPGYDIGEHAFWRVTHADDHCFDGRFA